MSNTSKSNFLNNTEDIIDNVLSNQDHVVIETNQGNVVLITEEEFNKLVLNINFAKYRNRVGEPII